MTMDPRIAKQLLQLQLSSPLVPFGSHTNNMSPDGGLFGELLQSILLQGSPAGPGAQTDVRTLLGMNGPAPIALLGNPAARETVSDDSTTRAGAPLRFPVKPAVDPLNFGKPSAYDPIVAEAAGRYGVDTPLIKAVIEQESSFNAHAVSSAGAKGLMQLMDGTAEGLGVTDPFDPQQNIHGGTKFLAYLLDKYSGSEALALAAYNAGPGRVDRLGISNEEQLMENYNRLPRETQDYVRRVLEKKQHYQV